MPSNLTVEQIEERLDLIERGLTDRQIAAKVGSNPGAIQQWAKHRGLEINREVRKKKIKKVNAVAQEYIERALGSPGSSACGRCGARWEATTMRAALAAFQDHKSVCPGASPEHG